MNIRLALAVIALTFFMALSGTTSNGDEPAKTGIGTKAAVSLPRSSPEEQGISSDAIREFVEAADKQLKSLHSFMLVRHGHVVAECWWKPQSAETPHVMHSLSKSFTSTAIGLAIEEGKLSLDDEGSNSSPRMPRPTPRRICRQCACAI